MSAVPMPPARRDETARIALDRAARTARPSGLWVSIEERCGEQLLEAFMRAVGATFTGRAA